MHFGNVPTLRYFTLCFILLIEYTSPSWGKGFRVYGWKKIILSFSYCKVSHFSWKVFNIRGFKKTLPQKYYILSTFTNTNSKFFNYVNFFLKIKKKLNNLGHMSLGSLQRSNSHWISPLLSLHSLYHFKRKKLRPIFSIDHDHDANLWAYYQLLWIVSTQTLA